MLNLATHIEKNAKTRKKHDSKEIGSVYLMLEFSGRKLQGLRKS